MSNNLPISVIILTDGYAEWPTAIKQNFSVLWVINNEKQNPTFGNVIRL